MSVILVDNAYFGHALRRAPRDGGWGIVTRSLDEGWSITSNSTAVIAKEYEQR